MVDKTIRAEETKMPNEEHFSSNEEQRISKYKNFSNQTTQQQIRRVRGYAIISKGDTPKQISKETYIVPSPLGYIKP